MTKPAIVIPAYNRPHSLQRLLSSLERAYYPDGVRLIISIDDGGPRVSEVRRVAERFRWDCGQKLLITHQQRLGLIGNVFFCGDLSQTFGSVILLEDDLAVSPVFYQYARHALDHFADDDRIAGVSLNALRFNGYRRWPFVPYLDDSDLFFLQVAWFQGQAYSRPQWKKFAEWRMEPGSPSGSAAHLHPIFDSFPETDWFPLKNRYLVETGRYYAFPRQSLSTNFGEKGTHFSHQTDFFQVPLQRHRPRFRMGTLDDSLAVYDSFQEILPSRLNRLTGRLATYDYAVDLNATRELDALQAGYILTTRSCRTPLFTFGMAMRPLVANVVEGVPGKGINFCRTADVNRGPIAGLMTEQRLVAYHWPGRPGLRKQLLYRLLPLLTLFDKD